MEPSNIFTKFGVPEISFLYFELKQVGCTKTGNSVLAGSSKTEKPVDSKPAKKQKVI